MLGKFEVALVGFERFGTIAQGVVASGLHEVKPYGRIGRVQQRFDDGNSLSVALFEVEAAGEPFCCLAIMRIDLQGLAKLGFGLGKFLLVEQGLA